MLSSADILCFLHIPKTGGTSLITWLNSLFSPERICPHHEAAAIQLDLAADPQRYRFITGHFGVGLMDTLPVRPRLMTWLRDPSRRLLSNYHYLRELPENFARDFLKDPFALRQRKAALRLSFHEWVQLPQEEFGIHNLQPRLLAGDASTEDQLLPRAIRTLVQTDHFGLTERMQDSVDLFCHRFVLPPQRFDLHLNRRKSNRQAAVPPATLRIIERQSQLSCRMLRIAREIFAMRWQSMLQDLALADELNAETPAGAPGAGSQSGATLRDRIHQQLEARYRLQRASVAPPLVARFPMSEAIHGRGWYQAVQLADSNRWVRWTGPEPTSVLFLNLPKTALLEISWRALNVMDYEVITSCQLRVNGVLVPATVEQVPCDTFPHARRFAAVVTPSLLQREPGLVKLEFCISRTFPEQVASDPERGIQYLGFCTDAIELRAI